MQLHKSAIDMARKAELEAESANAHMSISSNELKKKAEGAQELATKAHEKAVSMKSSTTSSSSSTTTTTSTTLLKKEAAAAMAKAKDLAKAGHDTTRKAATEAKDAQRAAEQKLATATTSDDVAKASASLAKASKEVDATADSKKKAREVKAEAQNPGMMVRR